jgi:hypothetical protein
MLKPRMSRERLLDPSYPKGERLLDRCKLNKKYVRIRKMFKCQVCERQSQEETESACSAIQGERMLDLRISRERMLDPRRAQCKESACSIRELAESACSIQAIQKESACSIRTLVQSKLVDLEQKNLVGFYPLVRRTRQK